MFYFLRVSAERASTKRRTRKYASPKRQQQAAETRASVLEHAAALFGERGWAGTGMRDVAQAAGVSVETVYATFGSKTELLMAALDVAVVGDAAPVALHDRPEFTALGEGTIEERTQAAARLVRRVNERTGGIGKALREGAAGDAQLAQRLADGERRRRADVARACRLIAGRPVGTVESEGVWALVSVEVHQMLVERAGWSATRYESWLADALARLLEPVKGTRS
jgi:AcrR family transcriptional regulator